MHTFFLTEYIMPSSSKINEQVTSKFSINTNSFILSVKHEEKHKQTRDQERIGYM